MTSNPGSSREDHGGVARNVAEVIGLCSRRLELDKPMVRLFSAVGEDMRAETIKERLEYNGVSPSLSIHQEANTASYLALMDGEVSASESRRTSDLSLSNSSFPPLLHSS